MLELTLVLILTNKMIVCYLGICTSYMGNKTGAVNQITAIFLLRGSGKNDMFPDFHNAILTSIQHQLSLQG